MSLYEVNEASTLITEAAHEDAEIIFGAVIDDSMTDEIRVTVIATGFSDPDKKILSMDSMARMQEFLNSAPSSNMPQIELPPAPQFNVQMPPPPVAATAAPSPAANNYQEVEMVESPETISPLNNPSQTAVSARDMLIAKAKAFKESQDLKNKHQSPEQLSMNVDAQEQQSLEEARRMAREVLSSPFSGKNLEVPAFIRKRQGVDINQDK